MNWLLLAFALSTALALPVFAEGSVQDVACSMAMGHDDQMVTMTAAMSSNAMAADGMAKADGAMSADDQMAAMVKACMAHPDMTMMDAMHMMN